MAGLTNKSTDSKPIGHKIFTKNHHENQEIEEVESPKSSVSSVEDEDYSREETHERAIITNVFTVTAGI